MPTGYFLISSIAILFLYSAAKLRRKMHICKGFHRKISMLTKPAHSFMAPKSMSSEVENIELKGKEKNNTDKLNLSGQTARQPISHEFLTIYKHPDKRAGQIQFVRVSILT